MNNSKSKGGEVIRLGEHNVTEALTKSNFFGIFNIVFDSF